MFGLSFIQFNLIEGFFWLFCALICTLTSFRPKSVSMRVWRLLALDFALFGISDFVEAYYPVSFLQPGGEWLLIWKVLCIIGFVVAAIWNMRERLFSQDMISSKS